MFEKAAKATFGYGMMLKCVEVGVRKSFVNNPIDLAACVVCMNEI